MRPHIASRHLIAADAGSAGSAAGNLLLMACQRPLACGGMVARGWRQQHVLVALLAFVCLETLVPTAEAAALASSAHKVIWQKQDPAAVTGSRLRTASACEGNLAVARCPMGYIISSIVKPIYGSLPHRCNFTTSYSIVAKKCLRQVACNVRAVDQEFGWDLCQTLPKLLTFQYSCTIRPPVPRPPPRPSPKPSLRLSPKPSPRPLPSPKPLPRPKPSLKPFPRPSPTPSPFTWSAMSAMQKRRAEELLFIFENSSTKPLYEYAENLHDGRGITFGRNGFCTGTSDGLLVVRMYVKLRAQGNMLAKYLPALERIDATGGGGDVQGLDGFIQAVRAAGGDSLFRQAQDYYADRLYFEPSQKLARDLGLRLALTKAQLYDAYIQHGYSDPGEDVYSISANGMADWVTRQLGGSPLEGVDEKLWLLKFLERRHWVLTNTDHTWRESAPRVDVYSWVGQLGGYSLPLPMQLTWDPCCPNRTRGPCQPQPKSTQFSIGGVIYGDFFVD